METIRNLFRQNHFQEGDILYVQRQGRKTVICLQDGRLVSTYEPMKNVMTELSPEIFESINKGIVVNRTCIDREVDGIVFMSDGADFSRRKKPLHGSERKQNADMARQLVNCLQVMDDLPFSMRLTRDSGRNRREVVASREQDGLHNTASYEPCPGFWMQVDFAADDSSPLESAEALKYLHDKKVN